MVNRRGFIGRVAGLLGLGAALPKDATQALPIDLDPADQSWSPVTHFKMQSIEVDGIDENWSAEFAKCIESQDFTVCIDAEGFVRLS